MMIVAQLIAIFNPIQLYSIYSSSMGINLHYYAWEFEAPWDKDESKMPLDAYGKPMRRDGYKWRILWLPCGVRVEMRLPRLRDSAGRVCLCVPDYLVKGRRYPSFVMQEVLDDVTLTVENPGIPAPDDTMPVELRRVLTELRRIIRVVIASASAEGEKDEDKKRETFEKVLSGDISSEEQEDLDRAEEEILKCYPCSRTRYRWRKWLKINLTVFVSAFIRTHELLSGIRLSVGEIMSASYDFRSLLGTWWFTAVCGSVCGQWNNFHFFH